MRPGCWRSREGKVTRELLITELLELAPDSKWALLTRLWLRDSGRQSYRG